MKSLLIALVAVSFLGASAAMAKPKAKKDKAAATKKVEDKAPAKTEEVKK